MLSANQESLPQLAARVALCAVRIPPVLVSSKCFFEELVRGVVEPDQFQVEKQQRRNETAEN